MPHLIFDAHLDIAWNALSFDRDQSETLEAIRAREVAMPGKARGKATVSLPEMRRAGVGVCLATVLARAKPGVNPAKNFKRIDLDYVNQDVAHAVALGQLAYYRRLERRGQVRMIRTAADLNDVWSAWENWFKAQGSKFNVEGAGGGSPAHSTASTDHATPELPIGYILSMEGCDPITAPAEAAFWFEQGLRTASLAHYGQSAYAMGTGGDGPLTAAGRELLAEFRRLGMVLDLTHTAETAFFQALEAFDGPVFASHNNVRHFVAGDRQFSDEQVKRLCGRGAVIGGVLDAWMLHRGGWKYGQTPTSDVSLSDLVDHLDHICQLAGNTDHVGIGSDLDGGYGHDQTPHDLQSIAHLHRLEPLLRARGYGDADVGKMFHGNWLRFFAAALPA